MHVQEAAVRTHYPTLHMSEKCSKNISILLFVVAALAAFFTLFLNAMVETDTEGRLKLTHEDVKTMGIVTGCLTGGSIVSRVGSLVCGCVRGQLDNQRIGLLAQTELAQPNV